MTRPYGEESVSSEFGEDPEIDSPDVEEEEEDFSDSYDNSEWEGDEEFDEAETQVPERPEAPDVKQFTDQGEYDEAFESYLRAHEEYENQTPGEIERTELDAETYNNLDRIGLTPGARPALREAVKAADEQLLKAANAEMRGDIGAAREHRQRSEYFSRDVQKEMAKDSPLQVRGKETSLKIAEGVIRDARASDSEEYKAKYPNGRGYDVDVREAIDAFNDNTTGDTVYVVRQYSPMSVDLQDAPRGLVDGNQLMQVKVPSHFESAKDLVAAARSSNMSVFDYLVGTGAVTIKPSEKEEPEPEGNDDFRGLDNRDYRKARGHVLKPPQIGGVPQRNRAAGMPFNK